MEQPAKWTLDLFDELESHSWENNINTPHYRRNYKAGHDNTTAYDLLDLVLIAGLTSLLKEGECETLGELFRELKFLMAENGLTTRTNQETGEREVCMIGGVK